MGILTVYPDAHIENTSVDSYTIRYGVDETWATIVAGAGNWAADSANVLVFQMIASTTNGQWERMYRNIILFDTSALPDGVTIDSAILSLYGDLKNDGLSAAPDVNIYTSTPNSETAIVTGDHLRTGTVAQCDTPITYANWSISGYNAFTLNAAGLASINRAGRTKFALRNANYDVAEEVGGSSSPPWVSGASSQLRAHSADNASGTSKAPKLVITYSGIAPTVTIQAITNIVTTTARAHGDVTVLGTSDPTQHGHCWAIGSEPTTSDSKTTLGAKSSTGTFISELTGLTEGQTYRVRAYATNIYGTSYSSELSFEAGAAETGAGSYPSDSVARVSSIRHIFQPGSFRMQLGVGDLGLDVDVADTAALLVAKWEEEMKRTIDDIRSYGIIPTPGQVQAKRPPPIGLGPLGTAAREEQMFIAPVEPVGLGPLGQAARDEQIFKAPDKPPEPIRLGPLGRAAREEQIFVAPERPAPKPTVPTQPTISERARRFTFPGFTKPAEPVSTAKVTEERPVTLVQPGILDKMLATFRLRKARPVSIEEEKAKFARLRPKPKPKPKPKPRRVGITQAIRDLMRFR